MARIFYADDDAVDEPGWYVDQGEDFWPEGPFPTKAAATDWRDGLAFNGPFIQQAAE